MQIPTSSDESSNSYSLTWNAGSWEYEVFSFVTHSFSRSLLELIKELSSGDRSLNKGKACFKDKNSGRSGALFFLLMSAINSDSLASSSSVSGRDNSRKTNSLDLAGKRREWISLIIRLCDKCLPAHPQRSTEGQQQEEPKQYPCWAHHKAISPSTRPEEQKAEVRSLVGLHPVHTGRETGWDCYWCVFIWTLCACL